MRHHGHGVVPWWEWDEESVVMKEEMILIY